MARNSADIAVAIQQVNGIVGAQSAALEALKTVVQNKASNANYSIGLGLTGMAAGDAIKVLSADSNGVPTAWGKEAGAWRVIADITTTADADKYEVTQDAEGNPISLSEVILFYHYGTVATSYESVWINGTNVSIRHAATDGTNTNRHQTFWIRKVGTAVYGICTTNTGNDISGMNCSIQAAGLRLDTFPNDEKITSIKFGSTHGVAYTEIHVVILGR